MLKAVIAILGMLATGYVVWKLLQWQGDATDAKGNIIDGKIQIDRTSARNDPHDQ